MANPFRAFLNIRRDELPLSLLMFGYFFLVITSFWILKPVKKGLFIDYHREVGFTLLSWRMRASQAESLAKILNMVVAMVAVTVFTLLARNLRRQQLTFVFAAFFVTCYAGYAFWLRAPTDASVWTFYLFGDLFSTLMVATFFAFLNDSTSCAGLAIVIAGIAAAAGRIVDRRSGCTRSSPRSWISSSRRRWMSSSRATPRNTSRRSTLITNVTSMLVQFFLIRAS